MAETLTSQASQKSKTSTCVLMAWLSG